MISPSNTEKVNNMTEKKIPLQKIALAAVMAALVYVTSAFIQIPIPIGLGDNTRLHVGNVMCLLSGMLLGPWIGGMSAGIGSMIFDLTNPAYIASAPFTFLFKFFMAWVCGKICYQKKNNLVPRFIIGAIVGALSYVVLYLSKSFIQSYFVLALPIEGVLVSVGTKALTSTVNGIIACVCAVPLGLSLRTTAEKLTK